MVGLDAVDSDDRARSPQTGMNTESTTRPAPPRLTIGDGSSNLRSTATAEMVRRLSSMAAAGSTDYAATVNRSASGSNSTNERWGLPPSRGSRGAWRVTRGSGATRRRPQPRKRPLSRPSSATIPSPLPPAERLPPRPTEPPTLRRIGQDVRTPSRSRRREKDGGGSRRGCGSLRRTPVTWSGTARSSRPATSGSRRRGR